MDRAKLFDLYNQILASDEIRARYIARFGSEAEDVCAEFLNLCLAYEQEQVPSLVGFLQWAKSVNKEIKREFEAAKGVRVMSVHGAKGLEAPIVFLADASRVPKAKYGLSLIHI